MTGKSRIPWTILLIVSAFLLCPGALQAEDTGRNFSIRPGLGFEYFSRTIAWNDEEKTSSLKSYFFMLRPEFRMDKGFSLSLLIGYAFSDFENMAFRELPFSVELSVGGIDGLLVGGEIQKNLFSPADFEIDVFGQFVTYLGLRKEWDIPGLIVEGKVEGKPSWMRVTAGPRLTYMGLDYFYPYVYIGYDRLWGKFVMDQLIQKLSGTEEKEITGKGFLGISLGATYEITYRLSLQGEARLLPWKKSVDYGISARIVYAF